MNKGNLKKVLRPVSIANSVCMSCAKTKDRCKWLASVWFPVEPVPNGVPSFDSHLLQIPGNQKKVSANGSVHVDHDLSIFVFGWGR